MYNHPTLVEPGVKYFLGETLKNCRQIKDKYINVIFNIGAVLILLLCLGLFFYARYKGRMNPQELKKKELQKQHYIMSKIRNFHDAKSSSSGGITGIQGYQSGHDILL